MQKKEKQWMEIEEIMDAYVEADEELKDKFRDVRVGIKTSGSICNEVAMVDRYKREAAFAKQQLDRLRHLLLEGNQVGWSEYGILEDRKLERQMEKGEVFDQIPI